MKHFVDVLEPSRIEAGPSEVFVANLIRGARAEIRLAAIDGADKIAFVLQTAYKVAGNESAPPGYKASLHGTFLLARSCNAMIDLLIQLVIYLVVAGLI